MKMFNKKGMHLSGAFLLTLYILYANYDMNMDILENISKLLTNYFINCL